MVNFEDGKLVKGAYIVINGIEYPVHMPEYSGNVPLSSENMNKMQKDLLQTVFPIGSTYVTQTNKNPNSILGFGTWERLKGKVCLGLDENDTDFKTIGKTGGEKTHKLTVKELPKHKPEIISWNNTEGNCYGSGVDNNKAFINVGTNGNGTIQTATDFKGIGFTGGDKPHNNMQPYEIVGYMWIRRS